MSVFCPKCGKKTYDEYSCDHCQYEIKPNNYAPKKNNNKIITISIILIAIAVSYLAINKFTEDTPQEKLLQSLYGTTDHKEIKNINDEIVKEADKAIVEEGKKEIELFNNILGNNGSAK